MPLVEIRVAAIDAAVELASERRRAGDVRRRGTREIQVKEIARVGIALVIDGVPPCIRQLKEAAGMPVAEQGGERGEIG